MFGNFSIGDVLPHSEDLSSWIVTVAMISNDIVIATSSFERILNEDKPTMMGERLYWFRLASSHYREALKFLASTHSKAYVVEFIKTLPSEVQESYRIILANSSKPDDDMLFGQQVVSTRNITFHYPSTSEIKNALVKMQDREGSIAFNGSMVRDFRSLFADDILLEILGVSSGDELKRREDIASLGKWTGLLIKFSNHAVCAYLDGYSQHIRAEWH